MASGCSLKLCCVQVKKKGLGIQGDLDKYDRGRRIIRSSSIRFHFLLVRL